jgi:hypothetical protein
MGQAQRQVAIIRQEDQPLAVAVEAPDRMQRLRPFDGQEIADHVAALRVVLRADETPGLVQGDVDLAARPHHGAIDHHPGRSLIDLGPQLRHDLAVDRDKSVGDEAFRGAAGGHGSIGEVFLETDHR